MEPKIPSIPLCQKAFYRVGSKGEVWIYKSATFENSIWTSIKSGELFFVVRTEREQAYTGFHGWWYRVIYGEMIGFVHLQWNELGLVAQVADPEKISE